MVQIHPNMKHIKQATTSEDKKILPNVNQFGVLDFQVEVEVYACTGLFGERK